MLTTQCPECLTRFKVSDAQLAVADGFVRCGRCAHVFNARAALQAGTAPLPAAPLPAAPAADEHDDFELELPDFTPEPAATPADSETGAKTPRPVPETAPDAVAEAPSEDAELAEFQKALAQALSAPRPQSRRIEPLEDSGPALPDLPLGNPFDDEPAVPRSSRESAAEKQPEPELETALAPARELETAPETVAETQPASEPAAPRKGYGLLFGLGALLGIILLAAQLVYLKRTRIGAELPELRPALEAGCAALGCSVPLPGDRQLLRTEWSELSYVPDHPGLIQFTAILKNHARYPQAWPQMELTLTDKDDRVLLRRVLPPADYLPKAEQGHAFAAGSQVRIVLRFDASALGQKNNTLGYGVNWLYPS